MALGNWIKIVFLSVFLCCFGSVVFGTTDAGDYAVLDEFRKGLANPELLKWPTNNRDPCGPPLWPHVFCSGSRVAQIQVQNLGLSGPLPRDFNKLSMLTNIGLQRNNFSGKLPSFSGLSNLQYAYLGNNQFDAIPSDFFVGLTSLQVLSLDMNPLNQSTGWVLPPDLADSAQLMNLSLVGCNLAGPLPEFLGTMHSLSVLKLSYNNLTGTIPASYSGLPLQILWLNNQIGPKLTGSLDVIASMTMLKDFLERVNYPSKLAASWSGNDPCASLWSGVSCFDGKVSVINLPNLQLNGTISPSLGKLDDLVDVRLEGNNLNGMIPVNMTNLKLLKTLDLSSNNISPPVPHFPSSVKVLLDGNKLLVTASSPESPSTGNSPSYSSPNNTQSHNSPRSSGNSSPDANSGNRPTGSRKLNLLIIIVPIAFGVSVFLLAVLFLYFWKRKKSTFPARSTIVVHPRDLSNPDNLVKIVVANNASNSIATNEWQSINSSHTSETHLIESGNLVISVQVLRSATRNFASENVLGKGGFGVVYKGELHDGTMIAVKRMESAVLSSKALDEFHAEIAVLSKVRHRNLVSILGYSIEEYERLLVYEYMPQGALSKHLFRWKQLELEPLSWKKRMNIALDVALTGKVTKKIDVFSFGVVLMELLTGLMALDENRPEESRYLVSWFCQMKTTKENLKSVIDPALVVTDENFESISIIAELAGHCAAREPQQRPDMGHAVNVLAQLAEKWRPMSDDQDEYLGIDLQQPLLQMVKGWQAADGTTDVSSVSLDDSKGSIPARPAGFAESFTSADGR
ncbi:hypothetical protein C4D60_Mb07t25270 [Musa balbisiana]|uniref:Protein kinase domain-containing protein n=1 Tax=Musa balbisiana TaxID=52838 RepID=A0A4S8JI44_MUSBA|nr:hypothetical protein C4D60_Mb07t25270 [Musa balbisiana]